MDALDIEGEAAYLLRDFDRPPGARALAKRHGLDLITLRGMRGRDAQLVTLRHRPTICVRAKLAPEAFRWAVLHELAEWHLARVGERGEGVEHRAEALTAALVMPRQDFREVVRERGAAPPWVQLALDFATTQTAAVLRLAEVGAVEASAVVASDHVHARGAWDVPEGAWRAAARDGRPGLIRGALTDARRRTGIVAA